MQPRFGVDDRALVDFAQTLARTPSTSGDERVAVERTVAELEALGFDEVEIDKAGNAIGILGDGVGPRLRVDGHIDSIPLHSADRWTVDPFGGEIVDGRLYGLGICDQKASIAAAAHGLAAAAAAGRLGGTVALVASVCEEAIEGAALAGFTERFSPDFAITSEPNDTRLCIGQRGRAKVELVVEGRACHAGHAAQGVNAAEALALRLAELVVPAAELDAAVDDLVGALLATDVAAARETKALLARAGGATLADQAAAERAAQARLMRARLAASG